MKKVKGYHVIHLLLAIILDFASIISISLLLDEGGVFEDDLAKAHKIIGIIFLIVLIIHRKNKKLLIKLKWKMKNEN